ncbi:unnamed protein product [Didymodactylos carnosus]|uniref:NAD(P)(+)--arginine ADP-ribosyltransferase n=1 Tax=Didymodactylos carnosus TaxID=1234261 RepID=A0A8S2NES1_9BILA|nr:unnamed protein product [Didymodactylos carnosus]CAF3995391.1 unnamed protein product [Didymodactylos carnosus]
MKRIHFACRELPEIAQMVSQKVEDMESPSPLPLTVYDPEQAHLFMAHQRTIDTILCMPRTPESRAEMIAEFRRAYSDNQVTLADIADFENTYQPYAVLQWYTRNSFLSRSINHALRSSNVDAMFKLRYVLTDLYDQLNGSHKAKRSSFQKRKVETFYRGQLMSSKEFDCFNELRDSIISINTFLSTTTSMQIALMYAGQYLENPDLTSVVFSIETDSEAHTRPYANISHYSMFEDEDEVLFAMGSVFRIGNIRQLPNADNIWIIHLRMIDQEDSHFNRIFSTTA